tara:strand:+ start:928 stop:1515 length:588 start_codon:yes stop_codon:yes gene_type:complete
MVRRQSGGNSKDVRDIMVDNLCRETKKGQSLKNKDPNGFVQIDNLCSTVGESSNSINNVRSNVNVNSGSNSSTNNSSSSNKSFVGGNILLNLGSMMTAPVRKMLSLGGINTSKITDTAKEKVNSLLNKKVETEVVSNDATSNTQVTSENIEEKITNKLENLSGGRRRTKKGKGKRKGRNSNSNRSKRRKNRTKRK